MRPRQRVVLNGAFRGQRMSGQQRYASEMAAALSRSGLVLQELALPHALRGNRIVAWLWAQLVGLVPRSGRPLLTLTSRGPLMARRHVVVIHDLFVLTHPTWFSRRYAFTHQVALRAQLRSAAALIAVSEPVARQVRALPGTTTNVAVVPNAPATPFRARMERPRRHAVLATHGLADDGFLLTVASTDPRKNLGVLDRATRRLEQKGVGTLPIVVVGDGSRIFADADEGETARRRIGRVTDDELADLYASCRAVLFPSLDEGFGLPAVEALAAGAHVFVSDIEAHRWVCGGLARYAPAEDDEAWAELLASAVVLPRRSDAEAAEVSDAIRSRFNWDESAATLIEVLRSISR